MEEDASTPPPLIPRSCRCSGSGPKSPSTGTTWRLYSDSSGYEYIGPPKGIDWLSIALEDESIPNPPGVPFVPSNPSGKQLLIVGSIDESVTPYSFAQDTAELLDSPLLSVESDIHAPVAWYDNDCINDVLLTYFLSNQPLESTTCT